MNMMYGPASYTRPSALPYRSVNRHSADGTGNGAAYRSVSRTLHPQLPSAITYSAPADDSLLQLHDCGEHCRPALCYRYCCSPSLLLCRRCSGRACESSRRPWKALVMLLLLFTGVHLYANMTFYRRSDSLFFFNLTRPAFMWSTDGRPVFRERWPRMTEAERSVGDPPHFGVTVGVLPKPDMASSALHSNGSLLGHPQSGERAEMFRNNSVSAHRSRKREFGNKSKLAMHSRLSHDALPAINSGVSNSADLRNSPNAAYTNSPGEVDAPDLKVDALGAVLPGVGSEEIPREVRRQRSSSNMTATVPHKSLLSDELPPCPPVPPDLGGPVKVDTSPADLLMEERRHSQLLLGGLWRPPDCQARHRVAIIIPYRDRAKHLAMLLRHLHPFLQHQQLDYGIFVVEQAGSGKFNRAMLLNIGALESVKLYQYQCFIFHDIDLLPEDDRNLYSCPQQPRHMSVAIDTFQYQLPYNDIFGGVSAVSVEHMRKVNGFSNKFWGWGGEDDDMSNRLKFHGLYISRYPANIARYTMLSHKKEDPNPQRYQTLYSGKRRFGSDGLNSIKYRVLDLQLRKLFTWIYVEPLKS